MKLRIPTLEELRAYYHNEMEAAFPAAELKPLASIEKMWAEGWYKPYCLYDDDSTGPIGVSFLWLGHEGWGLLDYVCVSADRRNDGLGAVMLHLVGEVEPDMVIFGEVEYPADAPDPAMAERRIGFYKRNGLRQAGYETEMFGVHYITLYLYREEVADDILMAEHEFIYRNTFAPDKYEQYVRIPYDPENPCEKVPWDQ